ncbi:MAG: hypothetical protein IT382_23225 [Deltaproteobacteria bacterium]|nr:hypothetical protein [Deltaproteobacteria bacterium]
MSRLGGVGNNPGRGGGAVGGRNAGGAPERVNIRDLPEDAQRAHELLTALSQYSAAGFDAVTMAAGVKQPVGAIGLKRVAALFESLGMPLHSRGIARFKADRGLPSGGGVSTAVVAKAYVRALDGNEILIRLEKGDEMALKPSERAVLEFLRRMQQKRGADTLRPVKELLGLNNPPQPAAAEGLENEYVGVGTLRELARLTLQRDIALTPDGWRQLIELLKAEKKKAKP